MKTYPIDTLFLDIGGVLLTDGWGRGARTRAVQTFALDAEEFEERHEQAFGTHELDKITLAEYLDHAVFHRPRPFTPKRFREFMFRQSQPFPEMLALARQLKARHKLKVVVVSNEGRELNSHRIGKFKLDDFVDAFVSSCYVQLRKPDPAMYRLALDVAQADPRRVAYLDDRLMFVEVASRLGIHAIHHTDAPSTRARLAKLGLHVSP